ncbi:MAG: hypothetical protein M3Q69_07300 [Acidobacteriota bacterium]|nr:hypothetical protein [Acidobacteriota bacterium]
MRKWRIAAASALLILGVVSSVQSMPANEVYTEFYEDDTYDVVVGYKWRGCTGSSQEGIVTDYRRVETSSCGNSGYYDCHYLICSYNWQTLQEDCVVNGYCY